MNGKLPKEVLNPLKAAQQYTARMHPPSAPLTHVVENYWVLRWDLRGRPAFLCEVIPSPNINLTFMRDGARITGVATKRYFYNLEGAGAIFGVTFRPGAFYAVWKQSVHKLTNNAIPASTVFADVNAVNTAVMSAKTDEAMIQLAGEMLAKRLPAPDKNIAAITDIINMATADDAPSVREIATRVGMSERALQALLRTHVGVGLKWIVLRARLQKAAAIAVTLDAPNWAAIAGDLGYVDQAHFVNDFKRIIGKPPAQYAAMARLVR